MKDMPDPLLSLHDSEYLKLIDLIDELRISGADRYVSLPQLVVCGDQSSGKSSVLEAISGVKFPVNAGQCTRFATEVCLRRTPNEAASASIVPGPRASESHKQRLLDYQERNVSLDQVPRLIEAASVSMGIGDQLQISNDKLRLEIQGPELPNFTLIDTPGIIHGINDAENELVEGLVFEYMKLERSIILAIVCTEAEVIGQKVLNLVRKVDPEGRRTVGIITKPDLIKNGRRPQFSSLARNETHKLRRGWHVVRNRDSDKEESFDQSHQTAAEQTAFRAPPWNELDPNRLGINRLQEHMKSILLDEIRQHLPDVVSRIESEKAACDAELKRLGPSRSSRDEQLRFLLDIQAQFRSLVEDGVVGRYHSKYLNTRPDQRLRNTIRHLNDSFSQTMADYGHTYHITDMMPTQKNFPSGFEPPRSISAAEYIQMIQPTILEVGRSQELPNHYDTYLSCTIFRMQSQRWDVLAREYLRVAFDATTKFLSNALESVTTPPNSALIWNRLVKPQLDSRWAALEQKLRDIMKPYAEFQPYSTPRRYITNLRHYQNKWSKLSSSSTVTNMIEQFDNSAACIELLLDMLAYYDNALETFTDNLISLAVESCLLDGLPDLISSNLIATMSNAELSKFASESEDTITRRTYARQKQQTLCTSLEILQDQLWTSTSLSLDPVGPRAPLEGGGHVQSLYKAMDSKVIATAPTHDLFQPNPGLRTNSTNGINPAGAASRTRNLADQQSRKMGQASPSSSQDISQDHTDAGRTKGRTDSASPSTATPSKKASEDSLTTGTEYSSLGSSPGESGGRRDRRRRSYGRFSPQPGVVVPVQAGSGSDSGMCTSDAFEGGC